MSRKTGGGRTSTTNTLELSSARESLVSSSLAARLPPGGARHNLGRDRRLRPGRRRTACAIGRGCKRQLDLNGTRGSGEVADLDVNHEWPADLGAAGAADFEDREIGGSLGRGGGLELDLCVPGEDGKSAADHPVRRKSLTMITSPLGPTSSPPGTAAWAIIAAAASRATRTFSRSARGGLAELIAQRPEVGRGPVKDCMGRGAGQDKLAASPAERRDAPPRPAGALESLNTPGPRGHALAYIQDYDTRRVAGRFGRRRRPAAQKGRAMAAANGRIARPAPPGSRMAQPAPRPSLLDGFKHEPHCRQRQPHRPGPRQPVNQDRQSRRQGTEHDHPRVHEATWRFVHSGGSYLYTVCRLRSAISCRHRAGMQCLLCKAPSRIGAGTPELGGAHKGHREAVNIGRTSRPPSGAPAPRRFLTPRKRVADTGYHYGEMRNGAG